MKKQIILIFVLLATAQLKASHIAGGAITWQCTSSGGYVFTLTLIRDCIGPTVIPQTEHIYTNAGLTISAELDTVIYINPDCNTMPCGLDSLGINFIGSYVICRYVSTPKILVGSPPPLGWSFYWSLCCRSNSTNLIDNSNLYIQSKMYGYYGAAATPCSQNTVQWNEKGLLMACTGQQQVLPPTLLNYSGDSVHYALTAPQSSANTNAIYKTGFSSQLPLGASNATTDSLSFFSETDFMQFRTNVIGRYDLAIAAKTYCNGVLQSEVVACFPVYIRACVPPAGICSMPQPSAPAQLLLTQLPNLDTLVNVSPAPFSQHNNYKHYTVNAKIGDTLKFVIKATDLDLTPNCSPEIITIKAYGEHMSTDILYASNSNCPAGYPCATLTSLNANASFSAPLENKVRFELPITCGLTSCSKMKLFHFDISTNNCPMATHTYVTLAVFLDEPEPVQPQFDPVLSKLMPGKNIFLTWNQYADTNYTFQFYEVYHKLNFDPYTLLHTTTNIVDTTFLHQNVADGTHTYRVLGRNNCLDAGTLLPWASEISIISALGIPEWASEIKIYPQPATNVLIISGTETILGATLELVDNTGRVLIRDVIDYPIQQEIDVKALPKGVYVLLIKKADYTHAMRVVK